MRVVLVVVVLCLGVVLIAAPQGKEPPCNVDNNVAPVQQPPRAAQPDKQNEDDEDRATASTSRPVIRPVYVPRSTPTPSYEPVKTPTIKPGASSAAKATESGGRGILAAILTGIGGVCAAVWRFLTGQKQSESNT